MSGTAMGIVAVALTLRAALPPVGHAVAVRLLLRARPHASVTDAAEALATAMGRTARHDDDERDVSAGCAGERDRSPDRSHG